MVQTTIPTKRSLTFKWSVGVLLFVSLLVISFSAIPIYHNYSNRRLFEKWNPALAPIEAQQDIQRGTIKIYLNGGLVSAPVGIEPSQRNLIKGIPTAPAGVGCIVENPELRHLQREYAIRYNQIIISYLQQHRPAA